MAKLLVFFQLLLTVSITVIEARASVCPVVIEGVEGYLINYESNSPTSKTLDVFENGKFSTDIHNFSKCEKKECNATEPPRDLKIIAPLEAGSSKFPVVLFNHGTSLLNEFYLDLLSHISSHGYIVVAPQVYTLQLLLTSTTTLSRLTGMMSLTGPIKWQTGYFGARNHSPRNMGPAEHSPGRPQQRRSYRIRDGPREVQVHTTPGESLSRDRRRPGRWRHQLHPHQTLHPQPQARVVQPVHPGHRDRFREGRVVHAEEDEPRRVLRRVQGPKHPFRREKVRTHRRVERRIDGDPGCRSLHYLRRKPRAEEVHEEHRRRHRGGLLGGLFWWEF